MTNSPYPYVTECFRNTVLQWIPMSIFWLILPLWFYTFSKHQMKSQSIRVSMLFITRMVSILKYCSDKSLVVRFRIINFRPLYILQILTILFLLIEILRIIHYAIVLKKEKDPASFLSSILYVITTITILGLMNHDRRKRIFSSGLLFIFWLFVLLASIPDIVDYSVVFPKQVTDLHEHLLQQ